MTTTETTVTKVSLQVELEKLYSKNQLIPRIRKEFTDCKEFDFAAYMTSKEIPVPFGFDLLVQMVLHKRTTLPVLVGILQHHFPSAQLTADMIKLAAECDLVDYDPAFDQFIIKMDITADVQEELDRYQFPLPMVVEPKKLTHNRQSGYLLNDSSVILKQNHHEDDVCLDHLNRLNAILFTIDETTAKMIRNRWRNLDKPKTGETHDDFKKRVKAFEKYDRTAKDVIAQLTSLGNEFYLTHRYDKRGRTYSQGYHVNYQGTPWNKAVIQLAQKELVE